MIGIVFVAMFIGSLSAATLVFSGWPFWVAVVAYIFCGVLGFALIVVLELSRQSLLIWMKLIASPVARLNFWRVRKDKILQPRTIPALSDWHFTTNRR